MSIWLKYFFHEKSKLKSFISFNQRSWPFFKRKRTSGLIDYWILTSLPINVLNAKKKIKKFHDILKGSLQSTVKNIKLFNIFHWMRLFLPLIIFWNQTLTSYIMKILNKYINLNNIFVYMVDMIQKWLNIL